MEPDNMNYPGTAWPDPAKVEPLKAENAFKPDMLDFAFALVVFVLGYLFSRWVLLSWQGWGVSAFTTAYLLCATAYLIKKGAFENSRATWFWLAVTFATGTSYALWVNMGFEAVRACFLFCAAVYYVIIASGRAVLGRTGNFLFIDGINAVIVVPFRNLINQYVSFSALGKGKRRGKILPVILGVLLALLLAAVLIPMLERADSGGFGVILCFFENIVRLIDAETMMFIILAIPIAAYMYGLVSGVAHRKGTDLINPESVKKTVGALRVMPPATVYIVLGAVCGIYLVFILSQMPYFFSAFTGRRPEGWLVYSEYARRGFFELCTIASINIAVLTVANVTCRRLRMESPALKAMNVTLAIITLVLIATAFSKMAMYIGAYGLTMPRLLPCVFMVFLAALSAALVALQKWDFSIVRFALVAGSVLLCGLCLSNPDAIVVRYNTGRYLGGTLPEYDVDILFRSDSAGVLPAIEVFEATEDMELKDKLAGYLRYRSEVSGVNGASGANGVGGRGSGLSLESYRARERLAAIRDILP